MSDDYDYNTAPEARSDNEQGGCDSDGYYYDPLDHFDEGYEIEKAERRYERYIGRS